MYNSNVHNSIYPLLVFHISSLFLQGTRKFMISGFFISGIALFFLGPAEFISKPYVEKEYSTIVCEHLTSCMQSAVDHHGSTGSTRHWTSSRVCCSLLWPVKASTVSETCTYTTVIISLWKEYGCMWNDIGSPVGLSMVHLPCLNTAISSPCSFAFWHYHPIFLLHKYLYTAVSTIQMKTKQLWYL